MKNLEEAEIFSKNLLAFGAAAELVAPVIEQHGLETVGIGGSLMAPSSKFTPVDQHLDSIMRVADWLKEK